MEAALAALRTEFGPDNIHVTQPVDGRAGGVGIRRSAHRWISLPLASLSSAFLLDHAKRLLPK